MKNALFVISTLLLYITSCSKGSEDALQQRPVDCDTTNMQYTADVLPVISAHCYGCHANGNNEGSISLDGYANTKRQADNGNLVGAISHADGYTPMPLNQPKLADCDVNKITAWVNAGAPEN